MLRLTEAEYRKMLGSSKSANVQKIKPVKRNIKSVVAKYIKNKRTARVDAVWEPEKRFSVEWEGATVLTLNEILRIDYSRLAGYPNAWKKACYGAMSALFKFAIDGILITKVIPEDCPEIITDIKIEQDIGSPLLRMTFEVEN